MGHDLPAPLQAFLRKQLTVIIAGSVIVGVTVKTLQNYYTSAQDEKMRQIRLRQAQKEASIPHTLLSKAELKEALEGQGFDMGFYEVDE